MNKFIIFFILFTLTFAFATNIENSIFNPKSKAGKDFREFVDVNKADFAVECFNSENKSVYFDRDIDYDKILCISREQAYIYCNVVQNNRVAFVQKIDRGYHFKYRCEESIYMVKNQVSLRCNLVVGENNLLFSARCDPQEVFSAYDKQNCIFINTDTDEYFSYIIRVYLKIVKMVIIGAIIYFSIRAMFF